MNGPALSAAERIEKFCDEWPRMRGLEREAAITLTDLRSLLADLRAARGELESLTSERDALAARVEVLTQQLADVVESFDRLEDDPPEFPALTPRELFESAIGRARLPCAHAWKFNGGNPMCRKCGTPKSSEPSEGEAV
jgi:hypothetical protein